MDTQDWTTGILFVWAAIATIKWSVCSHRAKIAEAKLRQRINLYTEVFPDHVEREP